MVSKEVKALPASLLIYNRSMGSRALLGVEFHNHGRMWSVAEETRLVEEFCRGIPLAELCRRFGRQPGGITARLRHLSLLVPSPNPASYSSLIVNIHSPHLSRMWEDPAAMVAIAKQDHTFFSGIKPSVVLVKPETTFGTDPEAHPINQALGKPLTLKENTMTTTVSIIKNVTFINGRDGSEVSDDEIFGLIAKLEQRANTLQAITHKPKKLDQRIAGIEADIAALVAYVDGR